MATRQMRADAGMTLLEVLVAMAIMALLVVMLSGGTREISAIWDRAESQGDALAGMDAMQATLRGVIGLARPDYASADTDDARIVFDGEPTEMSFIAPAPGSDGQGQLVLQRLSLAPRGRGSALVLAWSPGMPETAAVEPRVTVLLDNVTGLQLAYFGRLGNEDEPDWHDNWRDALALPALVRIHLQRSGAAGPALPDLVIAPRVTRTNGCVYHPADNTCQRIP